MKQHITIEQLQELPEMNMQEFSKMFNINLGVIHNHVVGFDKQIVELVNIGKMIKILKTEYDRHDFGYFMYARLGLECFNDICICDYLWEAVKKVIK